MSATARASVVRAQGRRDQVAAALRDATAPLRAKEVGQHVSVGFLKEQPGQHPRNSPMHARWDHWHECAQGGCYRSMGPYPGADAAELAALHQAGLAGREKVGQAVYWHWTGPTDTLSEISHPDFPATVRDVFADLLDAGVEIFEVDNPWRAKSGELRAGCLWQESNGPLQSFAVDIWDGIDDAARFRVVSEAENLIRRARQDAAFAATLRKGRLLGPTIDKQA